MSGVETNQADQTPVDSHAEGAAKPNGTNQNTSPPQPGEVERLRAYAESCERTTQDMIATTAKHFAEVERLREALERAERGLTWGLGLIVEFADLNGFRNMTDQELGASVQSVAVAVSEALDVTRAALTPSESQEA